MDFITSAVLGGFLWDAIKMGGPLTLDYVQQKAQGYIIENSVFNKLEILTEQLPEVAKVSEEELVTYIEENKDWGELRAEIAQSPNFTQNIKGDNAKGVQANNINTLNM